jgi:hypothetical protein
VFRAVVWGVTGNCRRATSAATFTGRMFGFAVIFIGVWLVLTGDLLNGLRTAFIGWYLESAAGSQIQQQDLKDLLSGHKVSEMMGRDCARVPNDLTLQQLVDTYILGRGHCMGLNKDS